MSKKILYIDNIKSFLALLVIIFHTNSAYGGEGGWYYIESSNNEVAQTILTFINALCQSFFMGLFFFIAAYFTPRTYDNKGFYYFLKAKVVKLLIPALFYYFILNPFCVFLVHPEPYTDSLGFYNMWFIVALLYFSIFYAILRKWLGKGGLRLNFPNFSQILGFIVLTGFLNFMTRLLFLTNKLYIHDFSLGYFPQYILFFWLGTVAYRNNWLEQLNLKLVTIYFRISLVSITTLPVVFILVDLYGRNLSSFYGGLTLESLYYSFWEPFTCVGVILKILTVFKSRINVTTPLLSRLNRSSYLIYIIQAPIIVALQLALRLVDIDVLLKVTIVSTSTLFISFIISHWLLKNRMVAKVV